MDGRLKSSFRIALWRELLATQRSVCAAFRPVWAYGKVVYPCFSLNKNCCPFLLRHLPSLLFFVAFLFVSAAHAGRYELVKGQGVDVCEAYLENLNSFHPAEPMRCDRLINPAFKDFQKPEWDRIDAMENFDLIVKVDTLLRPRYYANIKREVILTSLRNNIETGNYKFSLVTVDIDNDGQTDPVLRYLDSCWPGSKGPWGTPLVVLQQNKRDVDRAKSEQAATGHGVTGYQGSIYDVFRYKDITYFDYWSEEEGPLRVMLTKQGATVEICRLHFVR